MKWESIETAPKDGRVILGWRFYPVVIKWTGDKTFPWEAIQLGSLPFASNAYCGGDQSLTHWMPLPEPPIDI